jgi:opacity protein-like surface antigen
VAVLLAASPARAQQREASALFGFTPSAGLEKRANELSDLDIKGGFTWGLQGAWFVTPRLGAEVLWTEQDSALEVGTDDGKADLFTMTVRQLHGNVVYRLGAEDAAFRPFVFGGLGAAFFSADTVESETKFSLNVGAGVKYFSWRRIGARAHVRYIPTFLSDTSSGDFCDPFGFCQGVLNQFEFAGGVVFRF